MKRREFLAALAAPVVAAPLVPALIGLSRKAPRAIAGAFVDDGGALGHRLRDGTLAPPSGTARRVPIVIVGGGIAGLSAGWELQRRGTKDFVILELESQPGGNARSGENDVSAYPWAAHYVPVPGQNTTLVRELFEELGVLRDGVWEERYLCFSPQERLFSHGEWHEGIEPAFALDAAGRAEFARFDEQIAGHRASGEFTIPMDAGVRRDSSLDRMSMADWLTAHDFRSPAMRWYIDYACRDDFGALAGSTSAWAGIHYFASRPHDEQGPLTWPEGNGWIARRLVARLAEHIQTGEPVIRVEREGKRWRVVTTRAVYLADTVIFAAPTFLAPHIVPELAARRPALVYSPWFTANLTLDRLPRDRGQGAPLSWDNVIYGSPSLGYVDATHQSLRTHSERAVWTYYWSLAELSPEEGRRALLRWSWRDCVERILTDLERAHPDIRECVSRIDVMRLGHAMIRPAVGFLAATREAAKLAMPGLYLAHSDLSGLSLFEEAQFRGVMAARAVLGR
ncbi:MAG TPA: FAD-dependent oxidoreductase [Gemmatimonadaceae bacterium]|nr:FAD-dependent oxidoreductase [Gemmatimonadaceae bacterium]